MRPTPNEWDTNGCLSGNRVSGACEGFYASKGPVFDGKQCCYVGCTGPVAPCGRPLIVAGQPRVAGLVSGDDWGQPGPELAGLAARVARLSPALRNELAQAWRQDGLVEHASIAAFSAFALELMGLGAPQEFLSRTLAAATDEVRHAQLCFGLANTFDATNQAPAPLALADVAPRTDLEQIAAAVVEEACCAETAGALLAARQLEGATDPSVRAALSSIVEDETRHAELGWSFVAWALSRAGDSLRPVLAASFERGLDRLAKITHPESSLAASEYGRLARADSVSAIAEATQQVIAPARARLLAPTDVNAYDPVPAAT